MLLVRRLTTGPPSSKLGLLFEAASTASGAPTKWRSREAVDPPDELAQRFQRARDERARAASAASPHDDAARVLREHYGYDEVMLAGINSYRDRHAKTRLLNASIAGTAREVSALLALGADVHAKSFGGWTALHYAWKKGHEQIIPPLVLAGADVDQRIRVRRARPRARALPRARRHRPRSPPSPLQAGRTALHLACHHGHPGAVRALLGAGADPWLRDHNDMSPLHIAEKRRMWRVKDLLREYRHEP